MTLVVEHLKEAFVRHEDLDGRKQSSELALKFAEKLELVSSVEELRELIHSDILGSASAAVAASYVLGLNNPPQIVEDAIKKNAFSLVGAVIIVFARMEIEKSNLKKARN